MATQTKEAVNQQQSMVVETAQLADQIATFLVPNYNDGQKLAIVDEGVLKYLKNLLPKADAFTIISEFIGELNDAKRLEIGKLDAAVKCAKDFVAFHETINLMKRYFQPGITIAYKEPFNAAPRPLTITEMCEKYNRMTEELALLDAEIKAHADNQPVEVVNNNSNH